MSAEHLGGIRIAAEVLKNVAVRAVNLFFSVPVILINKSTAQRYQFCTVKHWACQLAKHSQRPDLAAAAQLTQSSWLSVGTNGFFPFQTR